MDKKGFGFVCTDGCLRRQAGMRGQLPKFITELCGWPTHNNDLCARIYHSYPSYLKFILNKMAVSHTLENIPTKYGLKQSCGTVYFAGIFKCK